MIQQSLITNYINYSRHARKLSERTCEEYKKSLQEFVKWAKKKRLTWSTVKPVDVQEWQMSMRHLSGATINERVSALRSFYSWLRLVYKGIDENPAENVRSARTITKPRETVDARSVIMQACTIIPRWRDERDANILAAILIDSGARLHEVTSLTWSDIDLECMSARIIGKGRTERTIYFTEATALLLGQYKQPTGRVFEEYSDRHFRYILAKYYGVNPHSLRHTKATDMLKLGAPLEAIKLVLGHKSVRTTERYLQPGEDYKRAIYDKYRTT